jgi:hypothetical protein
MFVGVPKYLKMDTISQDVLGHSCYDFALDNGCQNMSIRLYLVLSTFTFIPTSFLVTDIPSVFFFVIFMSLPNKQCIGQKLICCIQSPPPPLQQFS